LSEVTGKTKETAAQTSPISILREQFTLRFTTPTRCEHSRILTFQNTNEKNELDHFPIVFDEYLPQMDIRDRAGHRLIIIPRSLLSDEYVEKMHKRGKAGKPYLPIVVQLGKNLRPRELESIRVDCVFAYGPDRKRENQDQEKRRVIARLGYKMLRLVGYMEYSFPLDTSADHLYVSITAPKGYELKVHDGIEGIYHDERTHTRMVDAKEIREQRHGQLEPIPFSIEVPNRVAYWLVLTCVGALLASLLACLLHLLSSISATVPSPTVHISMIAASLTALIAMRALLFENVGLLNRLNKWYMVAFAVGILAIGMLVARSLDWTLLTRILGGLDP